MVTALSITVLFMAIILFIQVLFLRPVWKGSIVGATTMVVLLYAMSIRKDGFSLGAEPMITSVAGIVWGSVGMLLGSILQATLNYFRRCSTASEPADQHTSVEDLSANQSVTAQDESHKYATIWNYLRYVATSFALAVVVFLLIRFFGLGGLRILLIPAGVLLVMLLWKSLKKQ
jgi:hypothetical protein